jgi:hypothetical protein
MDLDICHVYFQHLEFLRRLDCNITPQINKAICQQYSYIIFATLDFNCKAKELALA